MTNQEKVYFLFFYYFGQRGEKTKIWINFFKHFFSVFIFSPVFNQHSDKVRKQWRHHWKCKENVNITHTKNTNTNTLTHTHTHTHKHKHTQIQTQTQTQTQTQIHTHTHAHIYKYQGALTEGEGSVQLTSSFRLFFKKGTYSFSMKAANLNLLIQGGQPTFLKRVSAPPPPPRTRSASPETALISSWH